MNDTDAKSRRRRATRLLISTIICLCVRPAEAQVAKTPPPPRFTAQPARLEPYERTPLYAKVQGFVKKSRTQTLASGEIEESPLADIGDHVAEGELLAEIDVPELLEEFRHKTALAEQAAAELQQAGAAVIVADKAMQATRARVSESLAGVARARGSHERWNAEYERIRQLAETGSVTNKLADETRNQMRAAEAGRDEAEAHVAAAQADLAEAEAAVSKARADEAVARVRVKVAEAEVGKISAMLKYAQIRAPFSGVVTQRNIDTGHFVQPGPAAAPPLFVVERIDTLRVAVDVPERDAPFIHVGNGAVISVPAIGVEEFTGVVARTSWVLEPASRTLRVEINLPNPQQRLRPGMYAKARIELQDEPKANVVVILADDLGYGDLGCYGQQTIKTPHIDRLAAEGMRFTQFYAGSTVCAPSRSVLMTGQHVGHTTIRGNGDLPLREEDVTVAQLLQHAGYRCGLIGKWGLGNLEQRSDPLRRGFDEFFGYLHHVHAHNYYPSHLYRNQQRIPLRNVVPNEGPTGGGVAAEKVDYSHDLFASEALQFIDRHKDGTFFLLLALTIPHANNEAGRQGMEVPDLGAYQEQPWPDPQKAHAAMISRMDADIGRLMRRLAHHGIDDRTVVFFTSDNGPHREGGHDPDFHDSNGPLRGIKRDLYEGGIRVPLIVRSPSKIKPGTQSDFVGSFADLLPTLAELAGVPAPGHVDGISFLPALRGEQQPQHEYLYWEFYEGPGGAQAVREGDWKAVRTPAFDGPVELYNLSEDLGETQNVATNHPETVSRMMARMESAHRPTDVWKTRSRRP